MIEPLAAAATLPGLTQALAGMRPPGEDIEDRAPVWDYMQNFWMDTDPAILLP